MNTLTKRESDLVPAFKAILKKCRGKENAMTSRSIIDRMARQNYENFIGSAQVRKIINFIRINNLVKNLIASSKGYYIEPDQIAVRTYQASLRARARAILQVANSYKNGKREKVF